MSWAKRLGYLQTERIGGNASHREKTSRCPGISQHKELKNSWPWKSKGQSEDWNRKLKVTSSQQIFSIWRQETERENPKERNRKNKSRCLDGNLRLSNLYKLGKGARFSEKTKKQYQWGKSEESSGGGVSWSQAEQAAQSGTCKTQTIYTTLRNSIAGPE